MQGGLSAAAARGAPAAMQQQAVRPKEEKEVLEHFAGVFALLNPQTFKVTNYQSGRSQTIPPPLTD